MARGRKICPSCQRGCGPRKKICECGYNFFATKVAVDVGMILKTEIKKSRGRKQCPCGNTLGVRSFECPLCHHLFPIKGRIKKKKLIKIDWHELQKDDKIKVRGGPYWLTQEGESIPMGECGKLRVISLDVDGLFCYTNKHKRVFVYMGEAKTSKHGTKLRPHILRKITK